MKRFFLLFLLLSSMLQAGTIPPPLPVKKGGTGRTTLNLGGILQGNVLGGVFSDLVMLGGQYRSGTLEIQLGSWSAVLSGGLITVTYGTAFASQPVVYAQSNFDGYHCGVLSSTSYTPTAEVKITCQESNGANLSPMWVTFLVIGNI